MVQIAGRRLGGKLGLIFLGWMAIAGPRGLGQTSSSPAVAPSAKLPAFDVATIRPSKATAGGMGLAGSTPDGVSLVNVTAKSLIANAYGVRSELIFGGPSWVGDSEYDVEAKVLPVEGAPTPHLTRAQLNLMMQALLADRFKLTVHTETREIPIYELTVGKGGSKLHEARPGDTYADGLKGPDGRSGAGMMMVMDGKFMGQGVPIGGLVDTLSMVMHSKVVDRTGLSEKYDITLPIPRERRMADSPPLAPVEGAGSPESSEPTLFDVVEEQLGLKLIATKGPGKVIVIDRIEMPSEN